MSYILNALRKSDQERQAQQAETLTSQILERNDQSHNKTSMWLILLVIINIGILGYFVIHHLTKPEVAQIQKDKKNEPVQIELQKPAEVIDAEISAIESQPSKNAGKKADPSLSIDEIIKTKNPQARKASQQPEKKSVEQSVEEVAESKVNPVKEEKSKEQKNTIPMLHELPYQIRRNVPDIAINVFVYSDLPENRFIMVAMQKYVTGQEIASGMMLKEIQEDGAVVEYEGRVFKIKRD
jgi:general secretion pathway protein B